MTPMVALEQWKTLYDLAAQVKTLAPVMQEMGESSADPDESAEVILQTPQLQLSFEDRAELRDEDRACIKQLGLKFRGGQSWPMFRSFRPGMVPWFIEAGEAQMLIVALQQLLM